MLCYIERDETTSFLETMFDYYKTEANRRMEDSDSYSWTKRDYDEYLEEKHETLLEVLIQYEQKRVRERAAVTQTLDEIKKAMTTLKRHCPNP